MKTKKLNRKKKKIWEQYGKDKIKSIQEYEINEKGQLVLVKSESFDYDGEEQLWRKIYAD